MSEQARKFIRTRGRDQEKVSERLERNGYVYYHRGTKKGVKYWSCAERTKCKCTLSEKEGEFTPGKIGWNNEDHITHVLSPEQFAIRKAKDAACDRLKELTLSAPTGTKAIEIVRKVLEGLSPEVINAMPTAQACMKRVRRLAKSGGVVLGRATYEDFLATSVLPSSEPGAFSHAVSDSVQSNSVRGRTEEYAGGNNYAHEEKTRLYQSGTLANKTVRLVDEDGMDLGSVPIDRILTAGEDSSKFSPDYKNVLRVESNCASISNDDPCDQELLDDSTDFLNDDRGEDEVELPMGVSENEPAFVKGLAKGRTISTSSTAKRTSKRKRPIKDATKSGEKCFVCGDDLLVSEALSSSEETFRKACCYLNVKSENKWFPKSNGQFYSFCELCTKEIINIHQLYRKVNEMQSLIFRKVEHVEKRIADAEIVDNWLADAPVSSAARFEGFRKQVLINYKNKLKLRREIRMGTKLGHQFTEIQPNTSAHMFASDPAETKAFQKIQTQAENGGLSNTFVASVSSSISNIVKRKRGRPKSKKNEYTLNKKSKTIPDHSTMKEEQFGVANSEDDMGDFHVFDGTPLDDSESVSSDREVKFWENDPGKLKLHTSGGDDDDHNGEDDWEQAPEDSDHDVDDDKDDKDWSESKSSTQDRTTSRKSVSTSKLSSSPIRVNIEKSPNSNLQKPKRKSHINNIELPDAVLRDGRVFVSEVEIIKNAPGTYERHPNCVTFSCGACGKIVVNFRRMKIHICGHHLGLFKCHICFKEISDARNLERHIQYKHSRTNRKPCPICGKPIAGEDQVNLRQHRWSHLNEEEKKDPQYASFIPNSKKDPNRIKRNHGLQTFMCTFCSKTFYRIDALRKHELLHTDDGPTFQCQFCGKIYKNKKGLHNHTKTCGKTSEEKGNEPLYTYPCPKCPVRLKTMSIRNLHMRKFHTDPSSQPFACPRCPRRFGTRGGFKTHKRVCVEGHSTSVSKKAGRSNNANANQSRHRQHIDNPQPSRLVDQTFEAELTTRDHQTTSYMKNSNSGTPTSPSNVNASSLFSGCGYNMFGAYPAGSIFQPQQSDHQ